MREFQKDFHSLYKNLQTPENKQLKQGKIDYIMKKYPFNKRDGICLDIGASTGIITQALADHFRYVIGSDIDLTAIKQASESHTEKVNFFLGDAMALPLEANSVDAIICAQTYEHVPSSAQLFLEIERVIKPNGIIFFSGPNKSFPIEPHYFLPFLHWFDQKNADRYLKLTGKGNHYYEKSMTYWALKKALKNYVIIDVTRAVFEYYGEYSPKRISRILNRIASNLPSWMLKLIIPFIVNINWLLIKKEG